MQDDVRSQCCSLHLRGQGREDYSVAIFFLVYVEKVSWSPSEGGVGGGALSGYLLDASQPAALLCCLIYNTLIAWTSAKSRAYNMYKATIFFAYQCNGGKSEVSKS